MLGKLNNLFEDVMSGRDYDERQVKNATNITNTMVKVLRFEFDVYKHFAGSPNGGGVVIDTIDDVVKWLRTEGDKIETSGTDKWTINGRVCSGKELLTRANNKRTATGQTAFNVVID